MAQDEAFLFNRISYLYFLFICHGTATDELQNRFESYVSRLCETNFDWILSCSNK